MEEIDNYFRVIDLNNHEVNSFNCLEDAEDFAKKKSIETHHPIKIERIIHQTLRVINPKSC